MQQFFLSFPTQQDFESAFEQYKVETQEGFDYSITVDIIGVVSKHDGTFTTDEDGIKMPNMVAVDGYHVNVLMDALPDSLLPYSVTPKTPYRVWGI